MNKKLVLLPTVLSAAVMMGCSDSGSDAEPYVTDVIIKAHDGAMQDGRVLPLGYPTKLEATAVYNNGTHEDVTDKASWSNSAELDVVQGYSKGEFIAVDLGSAQVTATFDGRQSSKEIQVQALEPTELLIEGRQLTFIDYPVSYKATTYFDRSSHVITDFVEWEIDNPDIASIGGNTVTATIEGKLSVFTTDNHAAYVDDKAITILEIVEGTEQDVDFFVSGSDRIATGTTTQLNAAIVLKGDAENPFDFTDRADWVSSCPDVLSVNSSGVVTANGQIDDCSISASYFVEGTGTVFEDFIKVSSFAAQISGVEVKCDAEKYFFGETQCSAYLTYEDSDERTDVTIDTRTTWSSDSGFSVDNKGIVTSVDVGTEGKVHVRFDTSPQSLFGNYELVVGLPAGSTVDVITNEKEEAELFIGGARQLFAISGEYDVTSFVIWKVESVTSGWLVKDGLVTAPSNVQIGEVAIVYAESPIDGDVLDTLNITVVELGECNFSSNSNDCITILESGEHLYTVAPSYSLVRASGANNSGATGDSIGYQMAIFNLDQAYDWCSELTNRSFDDKVWTLPNEDELDSLNDDIGYDDIPVGTAYWTTSTVQVGGQTFYRYYDFTTGKLGDTGGTDKTRTYYASCVADQ
ncbi:DUF1566 domain-containing protein [Vibrio sp. ZSDE26]|uniref:DUF1566 domain-containing protein n=1 Tax=Vibrio amylolyticus TaxID=2847292 RepID=A0A9X1XIF3_9VIBR|nr:DUF1566 domain-containing protein [Vibrio amylolyticus]MCK6262243.1 DUF1566 domain-containing protein [Vibrio amylolyticus]